MPDDPKAGTVTTETTATPEAGASGTGGDRGGEQETAEQKAERLEKEAADLRKKYEDEHRLRLSHEQKVREVNADRREGRDRATDADPLDAEIADLEKVVAYNKANDILDPVSQRELRRARQEREQRQTDAQNQQRIAQAREDLQSVPEDLKKRTWELWSGGRYWSIADAHLAAKGEQADALQKQLADRDERERKREKEILDRQDKAPGSPRGGGGGAASSKKTMPMSEYLSKLRDMQRAGDKAGAAKLVRQKDAGEFELDPNS